MVTQQGRRSSASPKAPAHGAAVVAAAAAAADDGPSHLPLYRTTWGIASPVEYDVPKCDNQTMGCSWDAATSSWIHTIRGTFAPSPTNIKLAAAHFHCHAPACLSVALYNNDTGELLCMERPVSE